jgi:predicted Zn-dependent peptidase
MTIGKELCHIEQAHLDDVKSFFFKYYRPINAILVVAGNIKTEEVKRLSEKWFGSIPTGEKYERNLPEEPQQTASRILDIYAEVPLDAFYKTWHMDSRLEKGYYVTELITEILAGGGSSRLYQSLVKEQQLFSNIECYHFGSMDKGLLAIEGKIVKGRRMDEAEKAVEVELNKIKNELVSEVELQKVKNKTESSIAFEDMTIMSRANSLANYELLGNANLMNEELEKYQNVTAEDVKEYSRRIFAESNSNTMHYYSKKLQ